MKVSLALLRLRSEPSSPMLAPDDYDLLVLHEASLPSTSGLNLHPQSLSTLLSLPQLDVDTKAASPAEAILESLAAEGRRWPNAVVPVPLWDSPSSAPAPSSLYCLPADNYSEEVSWKGGRYENLARVVNRCFQEEKSVDVESRQLILRLEQWLREEQRLQVNFVRFLCQRRPVLSRLRTCSHNPALGPAYNSLCHRELLLSESEGMARSTDLNDEVRSCNDIKRRMIQIEKYEVLIMNPLFNSGLYYKTKDEAPSYFALDRHGVKQQTSPNSADEWVEQFPLHRAAYNGDAETIRRLLDDEFDPNETDRDTWTPLHYAAFYGRLKATEELLLHPRTNVNARTKALATPLHFAALHAHDYVVELLLQHPKIEIHAKNNNGQRAIDLCESVQRTPWLKVAELIRNWKGQKIQVDIMDDNSLMIPLEDGDQTTAEKVLEAVYKELQIEHPATQRLFALWVCSKRLNLQLKPEHVVKKHLDKKKWREKVSKWAEGDEDFDEEPRLVFRRDARATLFEEERAPLKGDGGKNTYALQLLFEEARKNYLNGLYPCKDLDVYLLAAVLLKIRDKDGARARITEDVLLQVLPRHRVPSTRTALNTLLNKIESEFRGLRQLNPITLQERFLQRCWQLCVYAATFFDARVLMSKPFDQMVKVYVGVNDYGLHLIDTERKTLWQSFEFRGLRWEHKTGKSFIEVQALKGQYVFVLQTPQASHIDVLLTRLRNKVRGLP